MDLSALADFHLLAASGSLGQASRTSGRPKATLSRHIRQLEESLGLRLVERGRHALQLTAEGQSLYQRTHALLRDIEDVGQHLADGGEQPRGPLRVSAPVLFATTFAGRLAATFAARYPEVRLDLVAEDRQVDLVEEHYDVAIRVNPHPASELVGRCFARDMMQVVAPPALPLPRASGRHRAPIVPAVAMAGFTQPGPWHFVTAGRSRQLTPDYRLQLSSLLMVREAVLAGAGAALLPRSIIHADVAAGRLAAWGHCPERAAELWVLHSSRRLVSPKVTAFVEFLVECFPQRQLQEPER